MQIICYIQKADYSKQRGGKINTKEGKREGKRGKHIFGPNVSEW